MKRLFVFSVLFLLFSFSISAQSSVTNEKYEVVKITQKEFETLVMDLDDPENPVYKGKVPCIVDFYTDWCRPCKMLQPILQELAKEYKGKLKIYKVHAEEEKTLSAMFGVNAYPTMIFFPKKGTPVMIKGLHEKASLKKYIEQYLFSKQ